jgi:hypothetical protein
LAQAPRSAQLGFSRFGGLALLGRGWAARRGPTSRDTRRSGARCKVRISHCALRRAKRKAPRTAAPRAAPPRPRAAPVPRPRAFACALLMSS